MATVPGHATAHPTRRKNGANGKNGRESQDGHVRRAIDAIFTGLLEDAYQRLLNSHADPQTVNETLDHLILALRTRKLSIDQDEWNECVQVCRRHPVTELIHEDPFTGRAFSKPRGYAGDAVLMDYIYGREEDWQPPEASPLGRTIFEYTTLAPAPEGVRARRGFVADVLDRLVEEKRQPHVLSIAAGHLREAMLSSAVRRRKLGRFVALDGDPKSLDEVERCYGRYGVETVSARIRKLLTNQIELGKFDLVYSTGLFDYLGESTAQRLVGIMFNMLTPGGRLVVANFLPGVRDIGYMEVFMDWNLIYRTRHEMMSITMEIPQEEIRDVSIFTEENQNIIFLEVTRN